MYHVGEWEKKIQPEKGNQLNNTIAICKRVVYRRGVEVSVRNTILSLSVYIYTYNKIMWPDGDGQRAAADVALQLGRREEGIKRRRRRCPKVNNLQALPRRWHRRGGSVHILYNRGSRGRLIPSAGRGPLAPESWI